MSGSTSAHTCDRQCPSIAEMLATDRRGEGGSAVLEVVDEVFGGKSGCDDADMSFPAQLRVEVSEGGARQVCGIEPLSDDDDGGGGVQSESGEAPFFCPVRWVLAAARASSAGGGEERRDGNPLVNALLVTVSLGGDGAGAAKSGVLLRFTNPLPSEVRRQANAVVARGNSCGGRNEQIQGLQTLVRFSPTGVSLLERCVGSDESDESVQTAPLEGVRGREERLAYASPSQAEVGRGVEERLLQRLGDNAPFTNAINAGDTVTKLALQDGVLALAQDAAGYGVSHQAVHFLMRRYFG